jgi:bifunctional DNA-binding transcriptional regulator/antitoxin component of YhaV-PrlF toxin-antitoxin module
MIDFHSTAPFMNDFEQEIVDLSSLNKIIDLACHHIERLEVDETTNLLIALKLLLSSKEDKLHGFFQKAWHEFMIPAHQQAQSNKKTWTVEMGADGIIVFPPDLVEEVGFEEWDIVDVSFDKTNNTIVIKKVPESEENYPEGVGCMGDTLSPEEIQTVEEKGAMGLKAPWES